MWVVCVCRESNREWQQSNSEEGAGPADPGDLEVSISCDSDIGNKVHLFVCVTVQLG